MGVFENKDKEVDFIISWILMWCLTLGLQDEWDSNILLS
jgi:hypothetical protein